MAGPVAAGSRPRLVLVGGGHAHLRVLRSLAEDDWPEVDALLISPHRRQVYSGMVPGYLQGRYAAEDLSLDLSALCRAAGVRLVEARAERVDVDDRLVMTTDGAFPFTLASLDVGSVPEGVDLPGVREHALSLRPMGAAVRLRQRMDELSSESAAVRLVVVGAGAGGVEVALALRRRVSDAGAKPLVVLIDRGGRILNGYAERARRRAEEVLDDAGVRLVAGCGVVAVEPEAVRLSDGAAIDADVVVWISGPAPPPLIASSALPRSSAGYFSVDPTLRSADGAPVWGAGDCVDLIGHDLPKAGVYAVREGPILVHNLKAALVGAEPRTYAPQSSFLSLLNTADGRALLRWRGVISHSKPAWWLKDWIDRWFVRQYNGIGER